MSENNIAGLLARGTNIRNKHEDAAIASGERFNIFSMLRMESDEVATHSKFIAELLDKKGQHGQKNKYLKIFLRMFAADFEFNPDSYHVNIEYRVGKVEKETGGRIDIMLRDNAGRVIMIENKIYASEQRAQLLRYHNAFPDGKLIYLTLFGEKSTCLSSLNIGYETMSYQTEIIAWLEACKAESDNILVVRETIGQYINLIKKLTNQNTNKQMTKEIINEILQSKENLTSYKVLFDVNKELKKELVTSIVQKMRAMFEGDGNRIEVIDFKHDYGLLFSLQNEMLAKHNLAIRLNFEDKSYSKLIFGFYNTKGKTGQNMNLFKIFKREFPSALKTDLYPAYFLHKEYQNWYFGTLSSIYFDPNHSFYDDFKVKVQTMLDIFEESRNVETTDINFSAIENM